MAFETVKWAKGRKEEFASYMYNEIFQTLGDRAQLERKWIDLIGQLRARVIGDGTADVPFIGASDVEFPLTGIHFEPVYADLMQTLHIPQNFYTITPLREDMIPVAKPFERFLSLVERRHIKMRHVNQSAFIDLIGLGTCIYKDYIYHSARTVKEYGEGEEIVEARKVVFEPRVEHVPLKDFFIPAYASSINPEVVGGSPWVSHRFELTEDQFNHRADEGTPFLPNYDPKAVKRVHEHLFSDVVDDQVKGEIRREDEFEPWRDRKITGLHEVWARYDVDGDGFAEDIVVVFHYESQTILRATYNPFMHGDRPFHRAVYIPSFGFYGIGIAEQDEWSQIGMTRLFNSAINNTLIANQRMFSGPMGMNISPDEPIHGGKYWPLGPGEKVEAIQMGEVYPSIFQMMQNLMSWSEAKTGVSDLRQGNLSSMPARTPASTTLSVLQEGNKKFDMVLANLREDALASIGLHIVQNLIQISRLDPRWQVLATKALGQADGALVSSVLRGQVSDVGDKIGISVTATSSQVNKEVEKQSQVALIQLTAQIYPAMIQQAQMLAQAQQNPQILLDTVQAAYNGTAELLQRLLESFDIRNAETFLPAAAQSGPTQGAPQPGQPGAQSPLNPLGGPAGPGPFAQGASQLAQFLGQT